MFYNKCGNEVPEDAGFCPKCGNTIRTDKKGVKGLRGGKWMLIIAAIIVIGICALVATYFLTLQNSDLRYGYDNPNDFDRTWWRYEADNAMNCIWIQKFEVE